MPSLRIAKQRNIVALICSLSFKEDRARFLLREFFAIMMVAKCHNNHKGVLMNGQLDKKEMYFAENKSSQSLSRLLAFVIVPFLSPISSAMTIGNLSVAGSGCFQKENSAVEFVDQHLLVQVKTMVKKSAIDSIARGSCNFALPIQLDKNEKLVIQHSDVLGFVNIGAQSRFILQSEVFFAGGQGALIRKVESTEDQRIKKAIFESSDQEIQSQCGESLILRGNSSLTISGQNSRSTARLDQVNLLAEVVACEE